MPLTPSRKYSLTLPDSLDALSSPSLPQAQLGFNFQLQTLMGALTKILIGVFLFVLRVCAFYLCILSTTHMQ